MSKRKLKINGIIDDMDPILYLTTAERSNLGIFYNAVKCNETLIPLHTYEPYGPYAWVLFSVYRCNVNEENVWISQGLADKFGLAEGDELKIDKCYKAGKCLWWYSSNPEKFIEHFQNQDIKGKKDILEDILDLDIINEDVIHWLDENEAELLREVGLN